MRTLAAVLLLSSALPACSSYAAWQVISEVPPTTTIAKSTDVQIVESAPAGASAIGYVEINGNASSSPAGCASEAARRARDLGATSIVVHATAPMTFLKTRCIGVAYR